MGAATDRDGYICETGAYVAFDDHGVRRVGRIESYDEDNPGYLRVVVFGFWGRAVIRLTNDDVEVIP